ncbi:MAG: molybdate ABC transporter substrate-binding protein, partial [Peptococcaceae bacterium]
MKKKLIAMLLTGAMLGLMLTGCGGSDTSQSSATTSTSATTEKTDLVVFAAASMTETLTELSNAYMKEHPEVNVVLNFDSSGTLKTQIQEGADCDVFISAGQLQMDQLDANGEKAVNTENLDFVLKDSRFNILENKVALAVPEANEKDINS